MADLFRSPRVFVKKLHVLTPRKWGGTVPSMREVVSRSRLTLLVWALTATLTLVSLVEPRVLDLLRRTPNALHEPWRIVTAFLLERGGALEITFNLVALAIVGAWTERLYDRRRWLGFYSAGGLVGELTGIAWRPVGAGTSVAVAGLLGACATRLLIERRSRRGVISGAMILSVGVVATVLANLHGPPVLVGAVLAWLTRQTADA